MNSLKKIKEWLNTFTSFNEQEQVDCQRIRQFLEEEENLLLRDNVKDVYKRQPFGRDSWNKV